MSFLHEGHLLIHERSHTGEKSYQCSICKKACSDKRNLMIHERSHTGEKTFECSICDKAFSDKSN